MQTSTWLDQIHDLIRKEPMRVIVEEYPAVMPVPRITSRGVSPF